MFTRNLPIFLVFGAALLIGVGAIIYSVASGDDEKLPTSTLSQFDAEQAAKRAYYATDSTVTLATCKAQEFEEAVDTWTVKCVLDREGTVETTTWVVTPDGVAKQVDNTSEA